MFDLSPVISEFFQTHGFYHKTPAKTKDTLTWATHLGLRQAGDDLHLYVPV